jgi:hypothetical protein
MHLRLNTADHGFSPRIWARVHAQALVCRARPWTWGIEELVRVLALEGVGGKPGGWGAMGNRAAVSTRSS